MARRKRRKLDAAGDEERIGVNAATSRSAVSADRPLTKPTIGIVGCCALAASGHAAAAQTIS
jgi:hypothetical protein